MAEADLAALIPDPMPQWLQRAMDPSTSATDDNETVRTVSNYSEDHGGGHFCQYILRCIEFLQSPLTLL